MTITVNKDKRLVEEIRKAQKDNGGYCCCAIEKTPDTKCMCKEFIESKESGWCHCGLYHKEI